jgi:serine/threonine-protein kinase
MSRQEDLAGVRQGDILAGKYRVDEVLGVGGMGVVVAAHHVQLDDRVAIKLLLPETLGNQDAVARFAREARAAVKIKSEHVARVTDVGTLENGAPYMVMEYLDGEDLSARVAEGGPLPIAQAIEFVLQACEAIAEAHAIGIVHRDLKPANLFVASRPGGLQTIKVLDFGISKLTGLSASGGESSATKTSALMGSPLYMSPEQMQSSKNVDARGDIWALGVILFELITGASPFTGDTMPELILRIMSSAPPSLRSLRPDAPPGLEPVLTRCLEKDRERRYQTVAALAAALLPFAPRRARASVDRISSVMQATTGRAENTVAPIGPSEAPPPAGGATVTSFGRTSEGAGRSRTVLVALVVGAVILAGAVGIWMAGASSNDATSATAEAPPATTPIEEGSAAREERDTTIAMPAEPKSGAAPSSSGPTVDVADEGARATAPSAPGGSAPERAPRFSQDPPAARAARPATAKPKPPAKPTAPKAEAAASSPPAPTKKPSLSSLIDDRR